MVGESSSKCGCVGNHHSGADAGTSKCKSWRWEPELRVITVCQLVLYCNTNTSDWTKIILTIETIEARLRLLRAVQKLTLGGKNPNQIRRRLLFLFVNFFGLFLFVRFFRCFMGSCFFVCLWDFSDVSPGRVFVWPDPSTWVLHMWPGGWEGTAWW